MYEIFGLMGFNQRYSELLPYTLRANGNKGDLPRPLPED